MKQLKISGIALIIALIFFLSISCSKENPLIDNSDNSFKIIAVTGEGKNALSLYNLPEANMLKHNLLAEIPSYLNIKNQINRLAVFGSSIYVLIPEDFMIIILNRWDYSYINTISFASENLKPIDIAFSNATDAYVIFSNDNKACLIDLKFYKAVKYFETGDSPSSIISSNGKILITNSLSNTISVINQQNYQAEQEISVSSSPLQIVQSPKDPIAAIICGKHYSIDSTSDNIPPAKLEILDLNKMEIIRSYELRTPKLESNKIFPIATSISNNNVLFICTQNGIFKSNLKLLSLPILNLKFAIKAITSNFLQDLFLIVDSNGKSLLVSPTNSEIKMELNLPANIGSILII